MVHTGMGLQLQVQLVPIMQVFVSLDPSYHGQMCGEAPVDLRAGPWGGALLGVRPALAVESPTEGGREALAPGLHRDPSTTQHT